MKISLLGAQSAHTLARDMHRARSKLTKEIAGNLRKPAQEAQRQIRARILTADMRGFRKGGERFTDRIPSRGVKRPTARAVQVDVKITNGDPRADIVFAAAHVPARIRDLVPYWAGIKTRLRHPIMGNFSAWAGQRIPNVWTLPNERAFIRAVDDALNKTIKSI